MQMTELSAKILDSTGRLFLMRRKLLKRGHNSDLSKSAANTAKDIKARVRVAIKWHHAAAQLCATDGVQALIAQSRPAVASWMQAPWLVASQEMTLEAAADTAVAALLGSDIKELGAVLSTAWSSCAEKSAHRPAHVQVAYRDV